MQNKTKKEKFPKTKKIKLKSLPYLLAKKAFWIFLSLFFFSGILIFIFVYQPIKNQKEMLIEIENSSGLLEEENFRYVLEQWKTKQINLREANQKSYPDIFMKKEILNSVEQEDSSAAIPEKPRISE